MDNLSSCDLCTHQKCLELYKFVQILFNIFWERIPTPHANCNYFRLCFNTMNVHKILILYTKIAWSAKETKIKAQEH